MNTETQTPTDHTAQAWAVLEHVLDPEVPAVSVVDLGLVREVLPVSANPADGLRVVLTPTYSGCPATELIEASVRDALVAAGLGPVQLELRRSPAWTTDWMSEAAKHKLRAYGIAPPTCGAAPVGEQPLRFVPGAAKRDAGLTCPRCDSPQVELLSAFGSTACKSLYRCVTCREPFEYFKPI